MGCSAEIQQKVLEVLHSGSTGGHSGAEATYHRVKQLFAWPQLKQSVHSFFSQCAVCKQAKYDRSAYPGLLAPLPIPTGAWQTVSLDFIEGLPKSSRFDSILVVVDKLSKYAHFVPLTHPYTAFQIALVYITNIYKLHGLPKALISNRDRIFTSQVWKELFKLLKVDC